MSNKELLNKLKEQGFATDSCLLWSIQDISIALEGRMSEEDLESLSDSDKQILLDEFFEDNSDIICEFIGDLLLNHLR